MWGSLLLLVLFDVIKRVFIHLLPHEFNCFFLFSGYKICKITANSINTMCINRETCKRLEKTAFGLIVFFFFDSTRFTYSIRWASKHDGMADIDLIFICIFRQYPFRFAPLPFFFFSLFPYWLIFTQSS